MLDISQQYGLAVAAIFLAIWIVRELTAIRKRDKIDKMCGMLNTLGRQTADLHEWHAVKDSEGVPVWYVRRSLEEAIKDLSDNIGRQTDIFSSLVTEIRLMSQKVNNIPKTKG